MIAPALALFVFALQGDPAKDLLGCWQRDGDQTAFIHLEPARISFFRDGKLDLYRASYAAGKVFAYVGGMKGEHNLSVQDGVLTYEIGTEKETYRRLAAVPAELVPKALELGKDEPEAERSAEVRRELAARVKVDQEVRTDAARKKDMAKVDRDNTEWLLAVVRKHGWVDAKRFGAKAASQAFLLVQHSGHLPLMLAALPKIEADVKAGQVDPQDYALLHDRLQLRLGGKQRYGSQIGMNNSGEKVVLALEDPPNVEKRRKEIGLAPLSEYLRYFKKENGGKDLKFEED